MKTMKETYVQCMRRQGITPKLRGNAKWEEALRVLKTLSRDLAPDTREYLWLEEHKLFPPSTRNSPPTLLDIRFFAHGGFARARCDEFATHPWLYHQVVGITQ